MEALAFVEPDRHRLLAAASEFIPKDSVIYALMEDVQAWHAANPSDWRTTFRKIEAKYGYDTYGGNCHMVPNHAVILMALLHGDDSFGKSLMIANTAGWDTDCNSANIGCLIGIKNGLAGIEAASEPDWRGPVADRLYLPTADGGRCVTDALRESYEIVNLGRVLSGQAPMHPKNGARFHFTLPGSVQGFAPQNCRIENVALGSSHALAVIYSEVASEQGASVATPTFPPNSAFQRSGYSMAASPTLYSGQVLQARVVADAENPAPVTVRLFVRVAGKDDATETLRGPVLSLASGADETLAWEVPDTDGQPVCEVGIEVTESSGSGTVYLDWLTWDGTPNVTLKRPTEAGDGWRRAWVNAVDHFDRPGFWAGMTYALLQDEGTGFVFQGEHSWSDYQVETEVYPHLAAEIGLMANVRGMRRYLALTLRPDGVARLILRHDSTEKTLAEASCPWKLDHIYNFELTTRANGAVEGTVKDNAGNVVTLTGSVALTQAKGAVGLLVCEGHGQFGDVRIEPAL